MTSMRRIPPLHVLTPLLIVATIVAQAPPKPTPVPAGAPAGMKWIDVEALVGHVKTLASDEFEGRLTATPGHERAADYVAKHFEQLGLEPHGEALGDGKRSWFQEYPVVTTSIDEQATRFEVAGEPVAGGFGLFGATESIDLAVEGRLRFVGFGRTGGSQRDIDEQESLEGEIPLVLLRLPERKQLNIEQKFGLAFTQLGSAMRLAAALEKRGAKLVLLGIASDPGSILLDVLNYVSCYPGKPIVRGGGELAGDDQMGMFAGAIGQRSGPRLFLAPDLTLALLERLGVGAKEALKFAGGAKGAPAPKSKPVDAKIRLVAKVAEAKAKNVVAVLRGRDPELAREALVLSAHLDHIGRRVDGEIFNGGDDNSSGSSGLLEIAEAFARGEPPARSVLFLSVSGEELGLLGSKWFCEHPTWSLADLIANVNIDMIGRSGADEDYEKDSTDTDEVMITPSHQHDRFSSIVRDGANFARKMKLQLVSGDVYYGRSDHFNFVRKGVPAVFFCTGEHVDYHMVSDHPEKLDGRKMERVARLAYWTAWAAADAKGRPKELGSQGSWFGGK
jgi:hypothetical protein